MKKNPVTVDLVCETCSASFQRLQCQIKRPGQGRFCSCECMHEWRRNGSNVKCKWCGSKFYRRYGEQGDSAHQFCSRNCYSDWRLENATGYVKIGKRHGHRVVAEAVLGRRLRKGEVVHHIDHDKTNNHPSNLAVMPSDSVHARCHHGRMSKDELNGYRLEVIAATSATSRPRLRSGSSD